MKPTTTLVSSGVGGALLCTLALLVNSAALAQSAPTSATTDKKPSDAPEVIKLEAVSVTGSNIRRLDVEKVLPVTVISKDAMDLRSAITPVDMLTALPQVTSVPLNETTQGSAGARGDIASVNLRGIGTSNSLVLLNGRRLVAHPTSGAVNYTSNVNQLPTQGIAQIEVLRDSASSIYGSDAVAGVVNYVMRRDFRGTELKVRYGLPEHPGGESVQTTLTFGTDFAGGRGRFLVTADFLYRDAIYLKDRDFTANADHSASAPPPFNAATSTFNGASLTSFWPQVRVGTATTTTYFRPVNGVPTFTTVAPVRGVNNDSFININQFFIGSPRSTRDNLFSAVEYDLKNGITAFGDVSLYHAKSYTQRTPISLNAPTTNRLAPLAIDNPFNPFGSRFYSPTGAPNADGTARLTGTPQQTVLAVTLINSLLPDQTNVTSNLYRVVAGLRGKLGRWSWETAALDSRSQVVDKSPNYVRESLLDAALLRTDATAFNPFGYTFKVSGGAVVADQPYKNPKSVMDTFTWPFRRDGRSALSSVDARASGPLYSEWAGDISLAFGAEYRKEKFSDLRPYYISINPPNTPGLDPTTNDVLQFPPAPDSAGKRNVTSFYTETVVPLASPKNNWVLLKSVEISASARYEKFSDFGKTTKPKVGLNWKPTNSVMLRASYSEGFTAPSLPMLYAPFQYNTSALPGITDAYRAPAIADGPYVIRTYSFGNPALKPSVSRGKSAGLVLDVPFVKGVSVSADYWEIGQSDVIGQRSSQLIFDTDSLLLKAATAAQLAAGKTLAQVDLGSGTAAYKGDPAVVRFAVTPQDVTDFSRASNTSNGTVGRIFSISAPYLNLSKGYASGWDFGLNYASPRFKFGRLDLNSDWAYLRKSYTIQAAASGAPIVTERVNVGGSSRWRGTSTLSWRNGQWGAGVSAYYIGSFYDTGATTSQAVYESLGRPHYLARQFTTGNFFYYYRVPDTITYNLFASFRAGPQAPKWFKGSSLRLGVVNLMDTPPPLTSGATGYSTAVYQGLLVGRTWTLELSKQF
jgi:outer membrane receptor protein involved in Fe transport